MKPWPVVWIVAPLLVFFPVAAQQDDEDLEEQEQRYYERYLQREEPSEEADAEPQPPEEPEDSRAAFRARADELIRDRDYRASDGSIYRVKTDDPRLDTRAAVELLGDFSIFFTSFWEARLELAPYEGPADVFLFYSFHKYNQLLTGDFTFSATRPKGHYVRDLDVITLHTDADMPGGLADTLVHEAAHQLVDQRIYARGVPPSMWLAEGFGSYFGFTYRDKNGRFHPGRVGGKGAALIRGEKAQYGEEGPLRLRAFRQMVKKSGFEEPGDLVDWVVGAQDPQNFYFQNPDLTYATSWLLVHYLLHGDDGIHATAFCSYLEQAVRGNGAPETLYATVGMDAPELEAALVAHAKRIK